MMKRVDITYREGKPHYYKWETLSDLYRVRRGIDEDEWRSKRFMGRVLDPITSFWEYATRVLERLYHVKVANGYGLTVLSLPMCVYWCVLSVFILLLWVVLSPFVVLGFLWMVLIEFPADVVNGTYWEPEAKALEGRRQG